MSCLHKKTQNCTFEIKSTYGVCINMQITNVKEQILHIICEKEHNYVFLRVRMVRVNDIKNR